jgi:hypothetical protein
MNPFSVVNPASSPSRQESSFSVLQQRAIAYRLTPLYPWQASSRTPCTGSCMAMRRKSSQRRTVGREMPLPLLLLASPVSLRPSSPCTARYAPPRFPAQQISSVDTTLHLSPFRQAKRLMGRCSQARVYLSLQASLCFFFLSRLVGRPHYDSEWAMGHLERSHVRMR